MNNVKILFIAISVTLLSCCGGGGSDNGGGNQTSGCENEAAKVCPDGAAVCLESSKVCPEDIAVNCASNEEKVCPNGGTNCEEFEKVCKTIEVNLSSVAATINTLIRYNFLDNTRQPVSNKNGKKSSRSAIDCAHEIIVADNAAGIDSRTVTKYFDASGTAVTNCSISEVAFVNPLKYSLQQTISEKGSDFEFNFTQNTVIDRTLSGSAFKQQTDNNFTGTLKFGTLVFTLLDGTFKKSTVEFTLGSNEVLVDKFNSTKPQTELNYAMEFPVDGQNYHFTLAISKEDINKIDQSTELLKRFDLLTSTDTKIGEIAFRVKGDTKEEQFFVYDLNGDLIR